MPSINNWQNIALSILDVKLASITDKIFKSPKVLYNLETFM